MKRVLLSRQSQFFRCPKFLVATTFCLYACSKKTEPDPFDVKKDIAIEQPATTNPTTESLLPTHQPEIQTVIPKEDNSETDRKIETASQPRKAHPVRGSQIQSSSQKRTIEVSTAVENLRPTDTRPHLDTTDNSSLSVTPVSVPNPEQSSDPVQSQMAILKFWLGLGFNYFHFNQSSSVETETGDFSSQGLDVLSCGAGVDLSEKSGLDFQYHQRSGKIPTQGDTTIDTNQSTRKTMSFQYQHAMVQRSSGSYFLRFGLSDHQLPMLSTDLNNAIVNVLDVELMNATVGVRYLYKASDRLEYELLLNYQQLVSGKSMNGYQLHISPRLMFDGSVGVLRRFPSGFRVGLYWYGQSVDFDYDQTRAGTQSVGSEKLLDSTVQVRVGWDIF